MLKRLPLAALLLVMLQTPPVLAEDRTVIDRSRITGGGGTSRLYAPSLTPSRRIGTGGRYSNGYSSPGGVQTAERNHCLTKCRVSYGKYLQYCQATDPNGESSCAKAGAYQVDACFQSCRMSR